MTHYALRGPMPWTQNPHDPDAEQTPHLRISDGGFFFMIPVESLPDIVDALTYYADHGEVDAKWIA